MVARISQAISKILRKNEDNFFSLGATVSRALGRFIFVFLASYLLTKYEFGIFNIFLSIYFFSRLFSENSLNLPFIKFSTDGKYPPSQVNFHIILLKAFYVAVVSFFIIICSDLLVEYTGLERKSLLYLLPAMLLSLTAYMFIGQVLIAKIKMRALFIYETVNCLLFISFLAGAYFLSHTFTTERLVIIFSLSMTAAAASGLLIFKNFIDRPTTSYNKKLTFQIIDYSKFTILSGISSIVILKADVLMLGYFHSAELVGVYGMALFVNEAVNIIFDSILRICLPKASALSGSGELENIKQLYKQSVKNIYLGITPIILVIGLAAPTVINILYKGKYDDSISIIYIFLLSSLTKPAGYVAGVILGAAGKIKYDNRNCWLSALLNVALNFILIPSFGIIGAACASILSFISLTFLNCYSLNRHVLSTDRTSNDNS